MGCSRGGRDSRGGNNVLGDDGGGDSAALGLQLTG